MFVELIYGDITAHFAYSFNIERIQPNSVQVFYSHLNKIQHYPINMFTISSDVKIGSLANIHFTKYFFEHEHQSN